MTLSYYYSNVLSYFSLNHDPDLRIFLEIAGGLFHFKKDSAQYSLKREDYATKPLIPPHSVNYNRP